MHFTCLIPPAHIHAICDDKILVCSYGPIDGMMHGSIKIADSDESILAIHFQQMSREEMFLGLSLTVKNIRSMRDSGKWDGQSITCSFNDKSTIVPVSSLINGPVKATPISVSIAIHHDFGVI